MHSTQAFNLSNITKRSIMLLHSCAIMFHSCCNETISRDFLPDHTNCTSLQMSFYCADVDTFLLGMRINTMLFPW